MAKAQATGALETRIVVRLQSTHDNSPDQAEVLVSGVRVGYVGLGAGFPVSMLPKDYLAQAGIEKITAAELRTIVSVAKAEAGKLAAAADAEQAELATLVAGETL